MSTTPDKYDFGMIGLGTALAMTLVYFRYTQRAERTQGND